MKTPKELRVKLVKDVVIDGAATGYTARGQYDAEDGTLGNLEASGNSLVAALEALTAAAKSTFEG